MLSADEAAFLDAWAACADANELEERTLTAPQSPRSQGAAWAPDEHERFLEAMHLYPTGPWKAIAAHIGTRSSRQARTHAQKHKEKLHRRQRKLQRMQSYVVADRLAPAPLPTSTPLCRRQGIPWTPAEQERLREALDLYPHGPWRLIADHVGTRSLRQVMSYGQKRKHKLALPSKRSRTESDVSQTTASEVSIDELLAEDLEEESDESDLIDRLLFDADDLPLPPVGGDGYTNFTLESEFCA